MTKYQCPVCGSRSKIKLGTPRLSRNQIVLILPCECECGCKFDLLYNVNSPSENLIHTVRNEEGAKSK